MAIAFRITALPLESFVALFGQTDDELAARGARRLTATSHPGYPCRVRLVDAAVGEWLILIQFTHQPVDSSYRASRPTYVRAAAVQAAPATGEVPELVRLSGGDLTMANFRPGPGATAW